MRIARNILIVISLLLFLAAGGMWVRSYRVYDWWGRYFAKTDAVEQVFADGRRYREEKRSVRVYRGVESTMGSIGIGVERLDLVKTSPAILAVQWEPVADADEFRHVHFSGSRLGDRPFANNESDFKGLAGVGVVIRSTGVVTTRAVVVPYWFLMVCAALWPGVCVMRWGRRWRWKRMGRCVGCGYDLRGGGERCPECGRCAAMTNDAMTNDQRSPNAQ